MSSFHFVTCLCNHVVATGWEFVQKGGSLCFAQLNFLFPEVQPQVVHDPISNQTQSDPIRPNQTTSDLPGYFPIHWPHFLRPQQASPRCGETTRRRRCCPHHVTPRHPKACAPPSPCCGTTMLLVRNSRHPCRSEGLGFLVKTTPGTNVDPGRKLGRLFMSILFCHAWCGRRHGAPGFWLTAMGHCWLENQDGRRGSSHLGFGSASASRKQLQVLSRT